MSESVTVRISDTDVALLKQVVAARREDVSSFIRRAIMLELGRLSYLPLDQKKALGLSTINSVSEMARGGS